MEMMEGREHQRLEGYEWQGRMQEGWKGWVAFGVSSTKIFLAIRCAQVNNRISSSDAPLQTLHNMARRIFTSGFSNTSTIWRALSSFSLMVQAGQTRTCKLSQQTTT
jgi:hypothetical protein